jgi:O-antigen/teichoic acid export membrane protein
MTGELRTVWTHARVYGLGTILNRAAGVILVPVYAHVLPPGEFGVYALVVTTTEVLGVLFGVGLVNAMACLYFEREAAEDRRLVVSTAFVGFGALALAGALVAYPLAHALSRIVFGSPAYRGLFVLALLALIVNLATDLGLGYMRMLTRSGTYVRVSLAKLVLLLSSSLLLVVGLGLGAAGILGGSLFTGAVLASGLAASVLRQVGARFNGAVLGEMLKVGLPLSPAALLGGLPDVVDKYVLNRLVGAAAVGQYALGGRMAALLHMFISTPFGQIWVIRRLESMGREADPAPTAGIFTYYVMVVTTAALGLSVLAPEIVSVVASDQYAGATAVLPLLCLTAVMTGLTMHFEIGVYRTKRTPLLLAVSATCAAVSFPAHYLLASHLGIVGTGTAVLLIGVLRTGLTAWAGYRCVGAAALGFEWRRCAEIVGLAAMCYVIVITVTGTTLGVGAIVARVAAVCAFVAAMVWTPIMTVEERRGLFQLLRRPAAFLAR